MPYDPEDPRLTAYALGELEEDEIPEVEALLSQSPEGREFVLEIRATASLLEKTLLDEPAPGLTPSQHEAIASGLPAIESPPWHRWAGYGVAASLLFGFGVTAGWLSFGSLRSAQEMRTSAGWGERQVARAEPPHRDLERFDDGEISPERVSDKPDRNRAGGLDSLALAPAPALAAAPVPAPARPTDTQMYYRGLSPSSEVAKGKLAEAVEGRQLVTDGLSGTGTPALTSQLSSSAASTSNTEKLGRGVGLGFGGKPGGNASLYGRSGGIDGAGGRMGGMGGGMGGMAGGMGGMAGGMGGGGGRFGSLASGRRMMGEEKGQFGYVAGGGGLGGQPSSTRGFQYQGKPGQQPNVTSYNGAPARVLSPNGPTDARGKGEPEPAKGVARSAAAKSALGVNGQVQAVTDFFALDLSPGKPGATKTEVQTGKPDPRMTPEAGKPLQSLPVAGQKTDQPIMEMSAAATQPALPQAPMAAGPTGPATVLTPAKDGAASKPIQTPEMALDLKSKDLNDPARKKQSPSEPMSDAPAPAEAKLDQSLPLQKESDAQKAAEQAVAVALRDQQAAVENFQRRTAELEAEIQKIAEVTQNEAYARVADNPFESAASRPLSTFSIDVDTASYANIRRFLNGGNLPPVDAVRIEEMINYFTYNYEPPAPKSEHPFSVNVEIACCPWNGDHRLARVALKGKTEEHRVPSNLVFLIDVSGSMQEPNKLPLVQASLRMLLEQLGENDKVSIAVYAGSQGLALPPTRGDRKAEIASAIDRLAAGGSTNGGAGIQLAYKLARENFVENGVNRVILATDGDFNVGIVDPAALEALIVEQAKSKVFLSVLGFGTGNVKDATMERLADKGNGNYSYIDTLLEARKVLVDQMRGTLVTLAKDVKIQVDFNPAKVGQYRLIGYENRALAARDFADDTKDAGEIGEGHSVTALYELIPPSSGVAGKETTSKYMKAPAGDATSDELMTVKLRYKPPTGDVSRPFDVPVKDTTKDYSAASEDFKFASSVAAFGMLLRSSPPEHRGSATLPAVLEWSESSKGKDESGYRREFCDLVRKAIAYMPGR